MAIPSHAVEQLATALRGTLIDPDDARYDEARAVYNGMIDRRPALIARCADVAGVISAVRFARENEVTVAVRCGGHNGGGLGTVDDGLVIDLGALRGVRVDPASGTVQIEGGATLGDVDHATHAFGLAVPGGIISTTGIGGLTLGGGIGHLTRGLGLTIDNLLGVDIVLADGSFVHADADHNDDLFWAVRGGGGNFGIVTGFTFRAHPVANVVAGPTLWELDEAEEVMKFFREFGPNAPRELGGFFALLTVPPGPPFPEHLHLKKMCGIVWCYAGPPEAAEAALKPVRDFKPMALDGVASLPLPVWQSAFDVLYPRGQQQYWRADFVNELSDAAIDKYIEHGSRLPSWQSTMHLYPVDGAAADVGASETPWAYRDAKWAEVIFAVDPDPANAELLKRWAVDYWEAVHPYSAGGAYVNFMMDEGQERVRATYRGNYERLAAIKKTYDPTNFFHVNQNIRPGG
jgi:FAD/FMN-containing dehydrogenase